MEGRHAILIAPPLSAIFSVAIPTISSKALECLVGAWCRPSDCQSGQGWLGMDLCLLTCVCPAIMGLEKQYHVKGARCPRDRAPAWIKWENCATRDKKHQEDVSPRPPARRRRTSGRGNMCAPTAGRDGTKSGAGMDQRTPRGRRLPGCSLPHAAFCGCCRVTCRQRATQRVESGSRPERSPARTVRN